MDKSVTFGIRFVIHDKINDEHFRQTKVAADPTGRFHIGETFLPQQEEPAPKPPAPVGVVVETDPDKYCHICNISVTSQPQMKLHLEGSKHAKKLKALGKLML